MKQIILLIIAFFIAVSLYTVVDDIRTTIQTEETLDTNSTQLKAMSKSQKASSKADVAILSQKNASKVGKKTTEKKQYMQAKSTPKSKSIFIKKTIEAVQKVKAKLDADYNYVYILSQKEIFTPKEQEKLDKLKKKYRVKGIPCLLRRLKTHPTSIVVAQAALETGWGSSRFYREGNNIFGVWSFNKNEPRIAAGVKRNGKHTIYVKKYDNLEQSIEGYYKMMATNRHYKKLRSVRLVTDNPFEIIPFLDHYSELRHEYVKRLYYVLKANKFYQLDNPQYQPPGWTNIKAADPKYLLTKKPKPDAKIAGKCKKDLLDVSNVEDNSSSHAEDIRVIEQERKLKEETNTSK